MANRDLLWRVEGTSTYLLATVHVGEDGFSLPPKTQEVVETASKFVFEHDLDQSLDLSVFALPSGVRLSHLVGEGASNAAGLAWRRFDLKPREAFSTMPGHVAMVLSMVAADRAGLKAQFGVDRYLWDRAGRAGAPRSVLEDGPDVLGAMAAAPMPEQVAALEELMTKPDVGLSDMQGLVTAWSIGDIDYFERFLEDRSKRYPATMDAIISRRNEAWLPAIVDAAESEGTTVISVGALHLVGPRGIPALLSAQGMVATLLN
jgi:uncharacterized protein YbaP (TraB family)